MFEFNLSEFVVVIGLFLVIEGLIYALIPGAVKKIALMLPQISENQLRNFGVVSIVIGVGLVWLVRG